MGKLRLRSPNYLPRIPHLGGLQTFMAANPVSKKVFGHTWVSIHVRLLTIKHKLVPWSLGNISRHRIWLEQFTVNNSGCKSTFHRVFSIIFHTFFFFFWPIACQMRLDQHYFYLIIWLTKSLYQDWEKFRLSFFMSTCGLSYDF